MGVVLSLFVILEEAAYASSMETTSWTASILEIREAIEFSAHSLKRMETLFP